MNSENPAEGYRFGYARVSTLEQDEALQHDALMPWLLLAVSGSSVDKASGKLEHRPALDAMLAQLRPGDMVTVWRLDRLGRSLRHLIGVVADLEARGVCHIDFGFFLGVRRSPFYVSRQWKSVTSMKTLTTLH